MDGATRKNRYARGWVTRPDRSFGQLRTPSDRVLAQLGSVLGISAAAAWSADQRVIWTYGSRRSSGGRYHMLRRKLWLFNREAALAIVNVAPPFAAGGVVWGT